MIKNYLTLALKVLRRKPFYTFISLFGISFTLMILMLITALIDSSVGANAPMTDQNKMVFITQLGRIAYQTDTLYQIDSTTNAEGTLRYDTTQTNNKSQRGNSQGSMSYTFADQNLRDLDGVDSYTLFSYASFSEGYLNGSKYTFDTYHTDADYWRVFDFKFLYGGPFREEDVEQGNRVVVMTDKAAMEYFGSVDESLIGRELQLANVVYDVRGVVARPDMDAVAVGGDIFLPLTTIGAKILGSTDLEGPFIAVFKANTVAGRGKVSEQLEFISKGFQMPPEEYFTDIEILNGTFMETYAAGIVKEEVGQQAVIMLVVPVVLLIFLFGALPIINLINLNISRVFERKAEIGVRKAFGAKSSEILYQFIFENLVLTVIGAVIGGLLGIAALYYINSNEVLGALTLKLSGSVFFYFLLTILLFGILSGLLPAYRMSKTNVATALR